MGLEAGMRERENSGRVDLCQSRHRDAIYLDGIQFSVRHGDKADSTMILTALGVDMAGNKEVLARRSCVQEDKDGWVSLLHDLRTQSM
jgi:transposase-like protein